MKKLTIDTVGLIESDWNLKLFNVTYPFSSSFRINRIRLEFKETSLKCRKCGSKWINRIRLEFKVRMDCIRGVNYV